MVDLFEEIGKHANLKVEWAAQLDWGTIPADLAAGKADSFCAAIYANAVRARGMLFGDVTGRQYLEPFVRADDERFSGPPEQAFNQPEIRVVGWEGTPTLMQTQLRFPKAKTVMMSTMEGTSNAMQAVVTDKADVFFTTMADASTFMKHNPGKLRRLGREYYLGMQALALNAPEDEHNLLNFLNTSLRELKNDGTFDRLMAKWNKISPDFMEAAP